MSTSDAEFTINGRFLGQKVTGVQRYARGVVTAMDAALAGAEHRVRIFAPCGTADPGFETIRFKAGGPLSGHAWEQAVLPLRAHGRLLNLCNTAPAVKRDQVVCIHDANIFIQPQSYSRSFRTLYRTLLPLLAQRSARITTVSHAAARQIARRLPVEVAQIVVLPNGHEHALAWDTSRSSLAAAPSQPWNRGFVLALGSRAKHKNLRLLLDMAPTLDQMGLDVVIAGGGGDIFAAEDLTGSANVKLLDRVSDDDLAYLMEHAVCLAFPSWTEGFGLPIVEAMARGCPVVSSNRASMPEVCGDAALLADPADPAAWVQHIRTLLQSPALREDMSGRGRERVQSFSWRQTAAAYMELLKHPEVKLNPAAVRPGIRSRIAVIVATRGRPEVVSATVRHLLETQTLEPVCTIVSCADERDAGDLVRLKGVTVIVGPAGLAAQRNTALAALPAGIDVVVFFDDDFVADPQWLSVAANAFRDEADLVGFTGRVLADGIKGPGLGFAEAVSILGKADIPPIWKWTEPFSPYGCNMAFRASAIRGLRFDERLVLYGWLEDRDFGATVAKRGGRLARCAEARGVHMGVKGARVPGDKLGYSQVVNPVYMLRKGTMTPLRVADHIFRNVASNLARSLWPEPFIDRRGRLRGNLAGMFDVLRGNITPERALRSGQKRPGSPRVTAGRDSRTVSPEDAAGDGPITLLKTAIVVLSRHKFRLAVWVLCCMIAAFVYARSLPTVYSSAATVLLEPRQQVMSAETEVSARPALDLNRADSELQVMRSERLLTAVFDNLNLIAQDELKPKPPGFLTRVTGTIKDLVMGGRPAGPPSDLSPEQVARQLAFDNFTQRFSARRVGQSYVIELSYYSSDPGLAARVVNAAASAYLYQSIAFKADAARSGSEFVQGRLDALAAQAKAATQAMHAGELPTSTTPDADGRIIGAGLRSLNPSAPRTTLIVAFGGILGLMSGLFFITLAAVLDRRIRSAAHVTDETGLACLATVPRATQGTDGVDITGSIADGVVALDPQGSFAAAIRDLRTSIGLASAPAVDGGNPVVALTSVSEGTGASLLCMNLAQLIRAGGREVTVIDCDLRGGNRTLTARHGSGAISLADLLSGAADPDRIHFRYINGVAFLPTVAGSAGSCDADPLNPAFGLLLSQARQNGMVLLDLPPVAEANDVRVFASAADSVVIVAAADETTIDDLAEASRFLTSAGAHVIGAVINRSRA